MAKRINVDARLVELKAKRRARTITRAERVELDKLETRVRKTVEWVVEPNDEHGDIIDPIPKESQAAAVMEACHQRHFIGVAFVDVARMIRTGSDAEGETDRLYDYKARYYPDGRVVELTTDRNGLTPIEVTP